MISLFIILCLFIHNSRSKHNRKATAQALLTANNCFRNVSFTFDFKKLLEHQLRFVTDVVLEYFATLEV